MSDDDNKIKVFGSDDNLKALGELLSNETSRKIISSLMKREMYTNELSTKLDMRVSLVIHHLKKMEELGLLEITKKKIIKKGQEHRFFKMNSDIFITLNNTKEEVKEKGILKRIFKDVVNVTLIAFLGITSWLSGILNSSPDIEKISGYIITESLDIENQTTNIVLPELSSYFVLVIIIIISASLFVTWFSKKFK